MCWQKLILQLLQVVFKGGGEGALLPNLNADIW